MAALRQASGCGDGLDEGCGGSISVLRRASPKDAWPASTHLLRLEEAGTADAVDAVAEPEPEVQGFGPGSGDADGTSWDEDGDDAAAASARRRASWKLVEQRGGGDLPLWLKNVLGLGVAWLVAGEARKRATKLAVPYAVGAGAPRPQAQPATAIALPGSRPLPGVGRTTEQRCRE